MLSLETCCDTFHRCFASEYQVQLCGGYDEPCYFPADDITAFNRLCFREDFTASAFHEIAHWCIAGPERRKMLDWGYWYEPEGRNPDQQKQFEQFEVRVQAIEWLFCVAAGCHFHFSLDNPDHDVAASAGFVRDVTALAVKLARGKSPLPERARIFLEALCAASAISPEDFALFFTHSLSERQAG